MLFRHSLVVAMLAAAQLSACSSSIMRGGSSSGAHGPSTGSTGTPGNSTDEPHTSMPMGTQKGIVDVAPNIGSIPLKSATSSNDKVATVNPTTGQITAVGVGDTVITCEQSDGSTRKIFVTVTPNTADATSNGISTGGGLATADDQANASTLASSNDDISIKTGSLSGFKARVVSCQTTFIQSYQGGSQAWGCTAACNADESLLSGGFNFAAAKKNGWNATAVDDKAYKCSVNISSCTGGLALSTGCNTSCYATCAKSSTVTAVDTAQGATITSGSVSASTSSVPAAATTPSGLLTRIASCNTQKLADYGATQSWGCTASCQEGEFATAGGASFGAAFTNGFRFVPGPTGYSCTTNISACSGGLNFKATGCNSKCAGNCTRIAEPTTPAVRSRVVTCNAVKQTSFAGGSETWGCVAACDATTEFVASGGWDFSKAENNGVIGRPTVNNGFACAANISRCSGGLNVGDAGCNATCSATCVQVMRR